MQFKGHTWPRTAASSLVKASISIARAYASSQAGRMPYGHEKGNIPGLVCVFQGRTETSKPAVLGNEPVPRQAAGSRDLAAFLPPWPSLLYIAIASERLFLTHACLALSWPTAWLMPQSLALFSASPPVDLQSGCSMNSWETQGVTS